MTPKILFLDIETTPNLGYFWGLWDQNIGLNQLVEATRVLSVAWKWRDEKQVHFQRRYPELIDAIWRALEEADWVVHYNGTSFDIPHLNREFQALGLSPPAPYKQIDLLTAVRKQFKFPSNKLEYISQALSLEGKIKHEGFGLWLKCMEDDPAAWKRMQKYNKRDVTLLEELYNEILPWIPNHPNGNLYTGFSATPDGCPRCGSFERTKRGFSYTSVSKFQQYQCSDCLGYYRDTHRYDHTDMTGAAL